MNKTFLFASALAMSLTLASCSQETDVIQEKERKTVQQYESVDGMECLVPANTVSGEYTVEARSTSDGAVNYKDFSLQRISKIDNVRANPDSGISVTFTTPAGRNTSLRLSSATTGQSAKDYPVDEGAMSVVIPTTRLQGEISTISLVENGKTTENVKFAK